MKRTLMTLCSLVLIAALFLAGLFAVRKLHAMYKSVWDAMDDLTLAVNALLDGQDQAADQMRSLSNQLDTASAQIERLHRLYAGPTDDEYAWADSVPPYIAHACGGIDGISYTNSREAFILNYELGQRVFEIDFNLAEDGVLIACHEEADWRSMTGSSLPYSSQHFNELPLYGQYESLTAEEVIELMAAYPDVYVVTDTKATTKAEVMLAFSQLVYGAQKAHPEVLDRIIPQIYNEEMLSWITSVYPFSSVIYTLYQVSWTPESILDFCMNSGVRLITMPLDQLAEDTLRLWKTLGIRVAVHTVNDPVQAQQLFDLGVDMIYTDFLTPSMKNP